MNLRAPIAMLAFGLAIHTASACSYDYRGHPLIWLPDTSFAYELRRVVPGEEITWQSQKRIAPDTAWANTLAAEEQDLNDALTASIPDEDARKAFVGEYIAIRRAMRPARRTKDVIPFDLNAHQSMLDRLPAEFLLYVQGVCEYYTNNFNGAIEFWKSILALPEEQRRHKTVWAEFMVGRALLKSAPSEAIAHFKNASTLAEAGWADTANLAEDCKGWMAKAEFGAGNAVAALNQYADFYRNNDARYWFIGYESIKVLAAPAFEDDAQRAKLAADPVCREIITVWLLSRRYVPEREDPYAIWLDAWAEAGLIPPVSGAENVAWAAYKEGKFDSAERALGMSNGNLPMSKWVRAQLLLRSGDIDSGYALLTELETAFPADLEWSEDPYGRRVRPTMLVRNEIVSILLGRSDYTGALDVALKMGGEDSQATYIAEFVLTTDELRAYIESHPEASHLDAVLARRYARLGQWSDAIPLFPTRVRIDAERLAENMTYPLTHTRSKRAVGLFDRLFSRVWGDIEIEVHARQVDREYARRRYEAAEFIKESGGAIFGDWPWGREQPRRLTPLIADADATGLASDGTANKTLIAMWSTPDERERVTLHTKGMHRRYLRYKAAELMWQSAEALPNDDIDTVRALYQGGMYLRYIDPKAADRFYKALVWRNWSVPYAQEANKRRWFPKEPPEGIKSNRE